MKILRLTNHQPSFPHRPCEETLASAESAVGPKLSRAQALIEVKQISPRDDVTLIAEGPIPIIYRFSFFPSKDVG